MTTTVLVHRPTRRRNCCGHTGCAQDCYVTLAGVKLRHCVGHLDKIDDAKIVDTIVSRVATRRANGLLKAG